MSNRADLPRDWRPGPGSSGPPERRWSEFVNRIWTRNNCIAVWPLLVPEIPSSSACLVRARGPRMDYYWAQCCKGVVSTPRNILCHPWNTRAAARSTLETELTLAFLGSAALRPLCAATTASRAARTSRGSLGHDATGLVAQRGVCGALERRHAKMREASGTGLGVL